MEGNNSVESEQDADYWRQQFLHAEARAVEAERMLAERASQQIHRTDEQQLREQQLLLQSSSTSVKQEQMDTESSPVPFIGPQTEVARQIEEAEERRFFQIQAERIRSAKLRAEEAMLQRSNEMKTNETKTKETKTKEAKKKKKKKKLDFTSGYSCPWCDKIFEGESQRRIHQRTHGRNYHSDPEDDWATLF